MKYAVDDFIRALRPLSDAGNRTAQRWLLELYNMQEEKRAAFVARKVRVVNESVRDLLQMWVAVNAAGGKHRLADAVAERIRRLADWIS